MDPLLQLGIIFAFTFAGESLSRGLRLPIPGSIIAMVLTLLALLFGVVKERHLDTVGDYFLSHMTFFFIAPGVGLLAYTDLVSSIWLQLILVNLISFFLCYISASWTVVGVNLIIRRFRRG
jgi:holin-like protein